MVSMARFVPGLSGLLLLILSTPLHAGIQQDPDTLRRAKKDTTAIILEEVTVTATRSPRGVFRVPSPTVVKDSAAIRERMGNGIADLFRNVAGIDVTGVGPNQGRLSIRGQRGQRILMLEDGLRMNNSRRQQDFGELPALVDPNALRRVEVVKGPASVLYGTDAIGGVVNMISMEPPTGEGRSLHGSLSYRYSSEDRQQHPTFDATGHLGRFGFVATGSFRDAEAYDAPGGTWGNITLPGDTRVEDTGVEDQNWSLRTHYRLSEVSEVFAKYSRYKALDAGFGFVPGAALGDPSAPTIAIRYPKQTVDRVSAGYRASGLGSVLADRLEVSGWGSSNVRTLNLDVFVPFGPPGAGLTSETRNFTDLDTKGFRIEASRVLAGRHTITYGVDWFRDASFNTDTNTTIVAGFGPTQTTINDVPTIPNATFKSGGVFVQGDLNVTDNLNAVLGVRVQDVRARTRQTDGITEPLVSSSNQTVVASANVAYSPLPSLTLIGTVGRAFRAPNLVERFFNGATPEGTGFQIRNPDLEPETSVNVDLGVRFRQGPIQLEGFVFRNTISDGIRIEPVDTMVGPFPGFRNVNVDKIRDQGIELSADLDIGRGFSVGGNWGRLDSDNVLEDNNPVGDTFSSRITGEARYRDPARRFWAIYGMRHNGERGDVSLVDNPIGDVFPSFTVHSLRGGVTVFRRGPVTHSLQFAVENLTNELYAEFTNAAFFRPEPKRMFILTWRTGF